jgi:hypothetical protein
MTSTSWQASGVMALAQGVQDGILGQQVERHEQLGVIGDLFEQEGHDAVEGVAGSHQQQAVGFLLGS